MINYAYWLSNIPGIGIRTRNRLIGAAGSAREVYGLTEKQLLLIPGVEEKHVAGIMESKKRDYDTEYESMAEREIFFLSREEQLFPQRLAAIPDAPYSLYVKGLFHRSGIIRQWRSWGHAAVPLMADQWQRRSQEGLLHLTRGL